jgi:hypothetical protein
MFSKVLLVASMAAAKDYFKALKANAIETTDLKEFVDVSPIEQKLWGMDFTTWDLNPVAGFEDLGVDAGFGFDVSAYFSASDGVLLTRADKEKYLIMQPNFTIEAAGELYVTIKLYFIKFSIFLDFIPFSFTPIMYSGMLQLKKPENYCSHAGMGWELGIVDLYFSQEVNECKIGFLSMIPAVASAFPGAQAFDCAWADYSPNNSSVWAMSLLGEDGYGEVEYIPWSCTGDDFGWYGYGEDEEEHMEDLFGGEDDEDVFDETADAVDDAVDKVADTVVKVVDEIADASDVATK